MFYLSFPTDFGLGIDQISLTLYGKCLRILVGLGIILSNNSMHRAGVGL